jgi:glycine betaine/proline transport system ATP-binding protein
MKDGVIEQCDTPANIVLHPATEYVAKFTNEVPRERVLTCANVMDEIGSESDLSDLKVPHNAVIEKVAEAVLNDPKPIAVVDDNNNTIGVLHRKSIIHILFGKDEEETLSTSQAASV